MIVFIAWINDHILGVYATKELAQQKLDNYRIINSHLKWEFNPKTGWTAGMIARFRVEDYYVIEE